MRTTVSLDPELLAKAEELTGRTERSALLRLALEALVQRESAGGWRCSEARIPMPKRHRATSG